MPWQTPAQAAPPPPPVFSPAGYPPAGFATAGYPPAGYPPPSFGQEFVAPPVWPAKLGLVVPQIAVETGDLPRICVVSGKPTDNFVKLRWAWAPRWSFMLGLLLRLLISDRVSGYLPIHPSVRRQMRWFPVLAVLTLFVGVFMMAIGFGGAQPVVGVVGTVLIIGSLVVVVRQSARVPVRRASEGYLALPKASPEFAAAFRAGRPPEQRPYSAIPAKYDISIGTKVAIGLVVAFIGWGVVLNIRDQGGCSLGHSHPGVARVDAAFAKSSAEIEAINASGGGPLSPAEVQDLLASHNRLLTQIQLIDLKSADRQALDVDAGYIGAYDRALLAYVKSGSDADHQTLEQASTAMNNAGPGTTAALHSRPASCTTS